MDTEVIKDNKKSKKKMKRGKKVGIIVASIIGALVVVAGIGIAILVHFINKVQYVPLKGPGEYTILAETQTHLDDVTNPDEETSADTAKEDIDEYQSIAQDALANINSEDYEPIGDVYNILLIGSDTRIANGEGRSDTMLLISINRTLKKIVATSFLRDLYVYIPEVGYNKINAAYAYGGVELLLDTFKYNFSLDIDRYIAVDFYSFMDVIDILGGIDVDVKEDELYWCNQYIHASNLLMGGDEDVGYLSYADGSYQHLNGRQALAYARFRFVGNGDFSRTERQRKVVQIMFDKIIDSGAGTIVELLNSILPNVITNIPTGEFLELIATLTQIKKYDIISWGVPDAQYQFITVDGQSSIGVDFNYYIDLVFKKIYCEE